MNSSFPKQSPRSMGISKWWILSRSNSTVGSGRSSPSTYVTPLSHTHFLLQIARELRRVQRLAHRPLRAQHAQERPVRSGPQHVAPHVQIALQRSVQTSLARVADRRPGQLALTLPSLPNHHRKRRFPRGELLQRGLGELGAVLLESLQQIERRLVLVEAGIEQPRRLAVAIYVAASRLPYPSPRAPAAAAASRSAPDAPGGSRGCARRSGSCR